MRIFKVTKKTVLWEEVRGYTYPLFVEVLVGIFACKSLERLKQKWKLYFFVLHSTMPGRYRQENYFVDNRKRLNVSHKTFLRSFFLGKFLGKYFRKNLKSGKTLTWNWSYFYFLNERKAHYGSIETFYNFLYLYTFHTPSLCLNHCNHTQYHIISLHISEGEKFLFFLFFSYKQSTSIYIHA